MVCRVPGEPRTSAFTFTNPGEEQELHWIITAEGGDISDLVMRLDIGSEVRLGVRVPDGWSLKYEGGSRATLRDASWNVRREVVIDSDEWRVRAGDHTLVFDCVFAGGESPKVRVELRTREPAETLVSPGAGR